MRKNEIYSGIEMKQKLLAGIKKVSDAVTSTLGAKGQTVIIEKEFQVPHITKDGVTVAKSINLKDPIENMGAKLIKQSSEQTNKEAGDGTTTSTLLAFEMIKEGYKLIQSGVNPQDIRKGIEKTVKTVLEKIKEASSEISSKEQMKEIALVSSNGDEEISEIVASAFADIGKSGIIMIENSPDETSYFKKEEGYSMESGIISQHFTTNKEKGEAILEDVDVLVIEGELTEVNSMSAMLSQCAQKGRRLAIFCDGASNEVMQIFVENKMRGVLSVALIKTPGFGQSKSDILDDIAVMTGTRTYSKTLGDDFTQIRVENLGMAKKIVSSRDETTILKHPDVAPAPIEERVAVLREGLDTNSQFSKRKLEERVAKLAGGIGIYYVGAIVESELKEKRDRVEDTINSVRASLEEGVVCGGGCTLLKIANELEESDVELSNEERYGYSIIKKSLCKPFQKIISNAGLSAEVFMEDIIRSKFQKKYDVRKSRWLKWEDGEICDPTKVVRLTVAHSSSTAGVVLTSNHLVVFEEDFPSADFLERSSGIV